MKTPAVVSLILMSCLSLVASALPLTPQERAGQRLYREGLSSTGEPLMARVGAADILLPATAVPCGNCHGRDGLGRPEGGVRPPDITWRRLSGPYGQRQINGRDYPAYTEAAVSRAVQEGRDPANQRLDPTMPRFVLPMADQRNLTAYLKRLADERDPGLDADTLHLGTLLPSQGPLAAEGAAVAALLNAGVARINESGGIHGRQLQLTILDPGPDQASALLALDQLLEHQPVFALIAPLAPALADVLPAELEKAGVPLVGGLSWLRPSLGSRQIFEPLPGLREQLMALADFAGQRLQVNQQPSLILYQDSGGQGAVAQQLHRYLQDHGWTQARVEAFDPRQPGLPEASLRDTGALFYLGDGTGFAALAEQLQAVGAHPYLLAASSQVAGDIRQLPSGFSRRLFLAYPFVPGDWTPAGRAALVQLRQRAGLDGRHALLQVGTFSSLLLLSEGLKQAGRDASREKLLVALEGLHDFATGLTPAMSFGPGQRMGLSGAHIVTVDLPAQQFFPVALYKPLQTTP